MEKWAEMYVRIAFLVILSAKYFMHCPNFEACVQHMYISPSFSVT